MTTAEVGYGVERLPSGRRHDWLSAAMAEVVHVSLEGRIVAFDHDAAAFYGAIMEGRERAGRPMQVRAAQVAAICRARGAALATRNRAYFEATGLEPIDPWTAGATREVKPRR